MVKDELCENTHMLFVYFSVSETDTAKDWVPAKLYIVNPCLHAVIVRPGILLGLLKVLSLQLFVICDD